MKKVVVFGGAGFLGSHVCDKLSDSGYKVTIFDQIESLFLRDDQSMIIGDILSPDEIIEAVNGADIVFNFAGLADLDKATNNPIETVRSNILGNTYILEACKKAKIKRFVFASSIYVYSDSGGFYRCSKQACELYIENYHACYDLQYSILRYGSLYGPRSDLRNGIYRFIKQALTENKLIFKGKPNALREFIHVEDAADCSVEILKPQYANQHIILTGNQSHSIDQLLVMIKEIINDTSIQIEYDSKSSDAHYEMTPYTFIPKYGKKMSPHLHRDFGQGLLQVIEDVHKDIHPEDHQQHGLLLQNKKNNRKKI